MILSRKMYPPRVREVESLAMVEDAKERAVSIIGNNIKTGRLMMDKKKQAWRTEWSWKYLQYIM